jgi:Leucine-rich repeat (LRR) protein
MGNAETKERFEKAEKTKILTAHELELSNFEKLTDRIKKLQGLRSANLSKNKFEGAIPRFFLCDGVFRTLKVLDLSGNALTNVDVFSPLEPILSSVQRPPQQGGSSSTSTCQLTMKELAEVLSNPNAAAVLKASKSQPFPLETLNLSGNKLTSLPPYFTARFPTLKTLNLSRNQLRLSGTGAGSSMHQGGGGEGGPISSLLTDSERMIFFGAKALSTLDLSDNLLTQVPLPLLTEEESANAQLVEESQGALQTLSQLNLDGNCLTVLTLHGFRLAGLQVVSVNHQKPQGGIVAIDPLVYLPTLNPKLNSVDFEGSKTPKKEIIEKLKGTAEYRAWEVRHSTVIDKQLAGTASAKLMA